MVRVTIFCVPLALLLAAGVGCGRADRAAVEGDVTLDGRPVDGGQISFIPAGGAPGVPAWGRIEAARYSIPAGEGPSPGVSRVEVRWPRKTGKKIPAPEGLTIEEQLEAVPARYHSRSELRVQVQPGKNRFDFKLDSK